MQLAEASLERVTIRFPKVLVDEIDTRAPEGKRAEWIRSVVDDALAKPEVDRNADADRQEAIIERLNAALHRIDQTSGRNYYENNALLEIMFSILREVTYARVASTVAALGHDGTDDEALHQEHDALRKESEVEYQQLDDDVRARVLELRDIAVIKAREVPDRGIGAPVDADG